MALITCRPGDSLTGRQRTILKLMSRGFTSQEIVKVMFYSKDTVKHDKREIYVKLEAKNAAHAVSRGYEERYLP